MEDGLRGGIACTRVVVEGDDGQVRTHAAIAALIEGAALPPRVAQRSLAVFRSLATVEAALHRRPVEEVHFHEVGGHDAIVDIVGTACALEVLGVDVVSASAVATGTGSVRSAHGMLPNPAPATVRLLEGVPTYGRDVAIELTTPTGAALISTLCSSFGPLPEMRISASGFGGGTSELADLPNSTQVVVGQRSPETVGRGHDALLLETNLDDATGEQLGYAVAAALDAGAFDAWVSPVTMKKGRPGHVFHVLTDAVHLDALRHVMEQTTGTLGVRAGTVQRWPLSRTMGEVVLDGITVRMKVTAGRAKPEFDDIVLVATKTGDPLHDISSRAEEAWRAENAKGIDGLMSDGMFHYDPAMTDLIIEACRERLSMDPVSLDFGGLASSLEAELAGLMGPEGTDPATVLKIWTDTLALAVVSCDSPRFLSFIPAAPTKASLLFDMFVSCSSLHGTSWLEAAGVVVAENQALAVLSSQAGFPEGAGGCFVAGGSAGNLSALMVARDTTAHRRRAEAPLRPLIAMSEDAHSSVGKACRVLGVGTFPVPTRDHRLTGDALRAALRDDPRGADVIGVVATAGTTNAGIVDDLDGVADVAAERRSVVSHRRRVRRRGGALRSLGAREVLWVRAGRFVHRRPAQVALRALRLRRPDLPAAESGQGGPYPGRAVPRGPAQREPRGVEPERLCLPPDPAGPGAPALVLHGGQRAGRLPGRRRGRPDHGPARRRTRRGGAPGRTRP